MQDSIYQHQLEVELVSTIVSPWLKASFTPSSTQKTDRQRLLQLCCRVVRISGRYNCAIPFASVLDRILDDLIAVVFGFDALAVEIGSQTAVAYHVSHHHNTSQSGVCKSCRLMSDEDEEQEEAGAAIPLATEAGAAIEASQRTVAMDVDSDSSCGSSSSASTRVVRPRRTRKVAFNPTADLLVFVPSKAAEGPADLVPYRTAKVPLDFWRRHKTCSATAARGLLALDESSVLPLPRNNPNLTRLPVARFEVDLWSRGRRRNMGETGCSWCGENLISADGKAVLVECPCGEVALCTEAMCHVMYFAHAKKFNLAHRRMSCSCSFKVGEVESVNLSAPLSVAFRELAGPDESPSARHIASLEQQEAERAAELAAAALAIVVAPAPEPLLLAPPTAEEWLEENNEALAEAGFVEEIALQQQQQQQPQQPQQAATSLPPPPSFVATAEPAQQLAGASLLPRTTSMAVLPGPDTPMLPTAPALIQLAGLAPVSLDAAGSASPKQCPAAALATKGASSPFSSPNNVVAPTKRFSAHDVIESIWQTCISKTLRG